MITYKQLTLAEIFEDCQNKFDNDKYQFLSLLDEAIDLDEIIPVSFISHCYASTGRPRKHQLYPMLKALLIQRIFCNPCFNARGIKDCHGSKGRIKTLADRFGQKIMDVDRKSVV